MAQKAKGKQISWSILWCQRDRMASANKDWSLWGILILQSESKYSTISWFLVERAGSWRRRFRRRRKLPLCGSNCLSEAHESEKTAWKIVWKVLKGCGETQNISLAKYSRSNGTLLCFLKSFPTKITLRKLILKSFLFPRKHYHHFTH